ncbi:hypothetical protein G7B40_014455 [Aetokthonos hydrillicola Thurmond2011]|jgi:hypothetical protein|uniref:Uncharacterized protein n=1 Tax=Aetokthonos hydrillicola Thurmond2011 TaxID=2712845 RepID=A0AAP5MAD9_9CYAN|nr:hypothetical protein [Aetokthonos hydrillicola]MBO3464512.1 hypothetical protein [Aetokthonos hydrillicola CCALA 1050]MBW4589915.1 hypothetical protein [Aetokthonos hydrillicola CCALA 1050]MDR9895758.1 hypothetical protein [Aetokthonos hydrillicola Thurmond2011]
MKTNKLLFITLGLAAIIALGKSLNHQNAGIQKSKTYIALETSSPEITELSQNILDTLAHRRENQWTSVDVFSGGNVQNIYSAVTTHDLEALTEEITPKPSSDEALIQAIQRIKDEVQQNKQQNVYGFIVTKGTTNSVTLAAIREICQNLAQNRSTKVHISIIGISPANRLPMSTAVAPLSGSVRFAGIAQEEWQQLLDF